MSTDDNETKNESLSGSTLVSGFSWRSYIGVVYALFVFSPAFIWLSLVTVGARIGALHYCVLIFMIELARISGKPITKQEAMVIFLLVSLIGVTPMFEDLIYQEYFVQSPIASRFNIVEAVPTWYAPAATSPVWQMRTFVHSDWIIPIAVRLLSMMLGAIGSISLGLFSRELFIKEMKLPFPIQHIGVSAVETLTGREEDKLGIFTITTILGFLYGLVLYGVPFASEAAGFKLQIIPIPWVDFWYEIETIAPGASFGVATDILVLNAGFVLPFDRVAGVFIGSFFIFCLANPILVHMGWTNWATRYTPGMDFAMIWEESVLSWAASPLIGMGIAAGLVPILMRPKIIFRAIRNAFVRRSDYVFEEEAPISSQMMVALFLVSGIGGMIMVAILVPEASIWLLAVFFFAWSFVSTLISTYMIGVVGIGFEAPYIKELLIYSSGYKGYDVWFAPFPITGGAAWASRFKQLDLTQTTIRSYLKLWMLAYPVAILLSFLFVSSFWAVAPIPSGVYPGAAVQWPIRAAYQALWVTRQPGLFEPLWILYSFLIVGGLSAFFSFAHVPVSMLSIAAGANSPIPIAVTMLIGALTGQVIKKVRGKDWYDAYRVPMSAGLVVGESVAAVLGSAIAIVINSRGALPY